MKKNQTSVASVRLLMPLAMLCFRSSVIVVSIMNFTLKLAYLYKLTEKKRLIYMHLLLYYVAYQDCLFIKIENAS